MKKELAESGFNLISEKEMPEYRARGIWITHNITGCEIFHLLNDDSENLFSFTFKTPPEDCTGAAHIVEHAVLSGSKKYPLKDPFLSLLKGSMNTFLNAMTYPDKTTYPASSTLEKDYFNLMSVYGDAVFFPLLKKEVFHQEGCRFEIGSRGELSVNGVVYNEMQGNYSAHDSIAAEYSYRTLFPDSPYRHDSGGEPESILSLTYGQFLEFHKKYYHPSNCRIFLYGNIDTLRQCLFINEHFLSPFNSKITAPVIPAQPRWAAPREFFFTSPLGEEENGNGKSTITLNWLSVPASDPEQLMTLEVLAEILLGNAGSPLHKAVLDSGLGEDLSPLSGIEADLLETVFTVGIRGSHQENSGAFRDLVFNTLSDLVRNGIETNQIEGAFRRVEFRYREIRGGVPFGLRLLGKILKGWVHGEEPYSALAFEAPFKAVKTKLTENPKLIARALEDLFLNNPHYSLVTVTPDKDHALKEEKKIESILKEKEALLGSSDIQKIRNDNSALLAFQEQDDLPEIKGTIPILELADLPREIERIPAEKCAGTEFPCLSHDFFTNGICYFDIALDTGSLPKELFPYLPLYSKALCSCGLPGIPYYDVAGLLSLYTGGILSFAEASNRIDEPEKWESALFLRLKTLEADIEKGFDLFKKLMISADFNDKKRIAELVLEYRNDLKSSIINMGNSYAGLRAAAKISPVLAVEETWRGVEQYLFINSICGDLEKNISSIIDALFKIRIHLNRREGFKASLCGDSRVLPRILPLISSLYKDLSVEPLGAKTPLTVLNRTTAETLLIPSSVGYAATALPGTFFREPGHPAEHLLAHFLRTDYLWEKIRMRGGAYGVSASANGSEGIFLFSTYRDPQPAVSFTVFRDSLKALDRTRIKEELVKAIIGVIGKESHPLVPGEKCLINFRRYLYGISDEARQNKRDIILKAGVKELEESAEMLDKAFSQAVSVVLAGKETLESLNGISEDFTNFRLNLPL